MTPHSLLTPPAMNSADAPQVLLGRCDRYDRAEIGLFAEESLDLFLRERNLHGSEVLLKPNLIAASGQPHAVTHPDFVAAVAAALLDRGARVRLGDSPAFGSARRVCAKRGFTAALKRLGVEIIDFEVAREVRLRGGVVLPIAEAALDCDLLVGLAKVKAHNQMLVTLATKNLFGVVKGMHKALLHMTHGPNHRHFAEILSELPEVLPCQLHFADGIIAMHGSGPLDGAPLPFYCMASAGSSVALDTALLAALEVNPEASPLWRVAAERRLIGWDPLAIVYPGLRPEAFHGSGFLVPPSLAPVRFSAGRFVRGLLRRAVLRLRSL